MKRIVFGVALVASLVLAAPAAASTAVVSGAASYGSPLATSFTTSASGAVSVEAKWVPKNAAQYVLTVKHLTDPANTYSYDQLCQVYPGAPGSAQVAGDYTCSFASGEAGSWSAVFTPISGGRVSASMVISTP